MLPTLSAAALAVGLLVAARPVRADAVSDFRAGATVKLRVATVDIGNGPRSAGKITRSQAVGSLDLSVAVRDLGFPVANTLHLRGSSLGGGRVEYVVD
ncbi:MAG: hypothetical protein WKG01_19245 [Kofleriaceae bacterium]